MAKEARRKINYGKIAGAVSGRSLAMIDPTIATKRKYEKKRVEREANLALAKGIGAVAGGIGSLASSVGKNLDSWSELKSGAVAVGGKEAGAIDFSGGGVKGLMKRMMTSAPAGGQFTVKGKVFSGTELSGIGKAVQGGYQQTITPEGTSLFDAYGGTLKKGFQAATQEALWSPKGALGGESIEKWGSAYGNDDFTNLFQVPSL